MVLCCHALCLMIYLLMKVHNLVILLRYLIIINIPEWHHTYYKLYSMVHLSFTFQQLQSLAILLPLCF